MNEGRTVFAQVMGLLSHHEFDRCVERYHGNRGVRNYSCWDQFLTMAFAQLTYRESLRDIEVCLGARRNALYHSGIGTVATRSTMARANERRDWRIYHDFAMHLIEIARGLYTPEEFDGDAPRLVYAFDSTTIDLCMSLFPWARFRSTKSGVKLHTLLDTSTSIPAFIAVTNANVHDVTLLETITIEPGSFILIDKAYIKYAQLYRFDTDKCFFVTRAKTNMGYDVCASAPVDESTGVLADQQVELTGSAMRKRYPDVMRMVTYRAEATSETSEQPLVFLTNNFELEAVEIADLYRRRWAVELFFKWIKQHLRIKRFFGISENAVKTQIWIAVATYVLILIVKKRMHINQSPHTILQAISIAIFEKTPIQVLFQKHEENRTDEEEVFNEKQLILFE